jgi:hypothetical protein
MIGHCFVEVWLDDRTQHPAGGMARLPVPSDAGDRCGALGLLVAPSHNGRTLTVLAEATTDNTAGDWFVGQVFIDDLPDPRSLRHTYPYDDLDEAVRVWATVAHITTPPEVLRDVAVATTYAVPHPAAS